MDAADHLESFAKTARDIPDYCRLPLLGFADRLRAQGAEIERLRPDAELCKRIIEELVKRNGGSTPNWLIDMGPNDLNSAVPKASAGTKC